MTGVRPGERMVTLIDGREVSNYSEEWRHECEARYVARLPTKAERHGYLGQVESFRGREARLDLQKLAQEIFYAENPAPKKEQS